MLSPSIDKPFTVATLPRPLDALNGRVFASPVYSISAGRKRKRDEVVVGVDGESVNIYNVGTQTIAGSYAIPSHTSLTVGPCSVYYRRPKPFMPQRHTRIVLRDGPNSKRLRLVSYVEDHGHFQTRQRDMKAPGRFERKLRQGEVIGIDTIQNSEKDQTQVPGVLIHYRDGHVAHFNGDLSKSIWEHQSPEPETVEVDFAAVVDADTARKGLLKSHEDIQARNDPRNPSTSHTLSQLLFQVIRLEDHMRVRIFMIGNNLPDVLHSHRSPLEEIVAYDLPARIRNADDRGKFELHAASGRLYYHSRDRLTIFNLCGVSPKVEYRMGRKDELAVTSFARLSSTTVFVVTPVSWTIIETKYGSSIASRLLSRHEHDMTESNLASFVSHPLEACTYLQDLGVLVSIHASELTAVQLNEGLHKRKRKNEHPLLVDLLGKGQLPDGSLTGRMAMKARNAEKWQRWKSSVDDYVREDDIEGLERFVALDINLENVEPELTLAKPVNGHHEEAQPPVWRFNPISYDPQHVDSKKALYLLGKTLAWRSDTLQLGDGPLHLEFVVKSFNIIRWLALSGYLCATSVELAVSPTAPGDGAAGRVGPGDIIKAVQLFDTGFHLLCELFTLPVYWHLADIVQALQSLITSLDTVAENDETKMLTGPRETERDIVMADEDVDHQFEAEAAAAAQELEYAKFVFDSGLRIRSETLRVLIARLESFPNDEIVKALRSKLSTDETIFLIAILRVELRDGGWTARHVADEVDEMDTAVSGDLGNAEQLSSSDQALRTIARLLNCCIDAVGVSGWLIGRSADYEGTKALIETVRAEVSAALEGCFEAEALGRCLDDIMRLSGSEETTGQQAQPDQDLLPDQVVMPLGGKRALPVLKTLQSKDGRKSRAALAEERSRAIGKYTFEQIRF